MEESEVKTIDCGLWNWASGPSVGRDPEEIKYIYCDNKVCGELLDSLYTTSTTGFMVVGIKPFLKMHEWYDKSIFGKLTRFMFWLRWYLLGSFKWGNTEVW